MRLEPPAPPQIGQQRRLPNADLTANRQYETLAPAHGSNQSVTRGTVASTPAQARRFGPAEMTGSIDIPHPRPRISTNLPRISPGSVPRFRWAGSRLAA